ncbi:MAG: glycosyltransferase family 87 protein [Actinomycetes bacterium]
MADHKEDSKTSVSVQTGPTPGRPKVLIAIGVLSILAWSALSYSSILHGQWLFSIASDRRFEDLLERFRDGAIVLHGGDLYVLRPRLNNTNPPVVSLLYLPLRAMGNHPAAFIMTAISLGSVAGVGAIGYRRITRATAAASWVFGSVLFIPVAILASSPLRSVLIEGQIRTVLLIAVVADLTVMPRRSRGILTGIAGSLSIAPLAFLALFWIRSEKAAVWRGLVSALVMSVIGLLAGLKASVHFWGVLLPTGQQSSRMVTSNGVAHFDATYNTSLIALQTRASAGGGLPIHRWMVIVLLVATLPILWKVLNRLMAESLLMSSILVLAVWTLLFAPVSWEHYWVYALIGPFVATEAWNRCRPLSFGAIVVTAGCTVAGYTDIQENGGGFTHDVYLLFSHNLYCLVGLVFLVCASVGALRMVRSEPDALHSITSAT